MTRRDFENRMTRIKEEVKDRKYKNVYNSLLSSLEENFSLFHTNDIKFPSIWFQTILDRFTIIIGNTKLMIENRLSKILDLIIDLEIKSKEIQISVKNIYQLDSHVKHGIR